MEVSGLTYRTAKAVYFRPQHISYCKITQVTVDFTRPGLMVFHSPSSLEQSSPSVDGVFLITLDTSTRLKNLQGNEF